MRPIDKTTAINARKSWCMVRPPVGRRIAAAFKLNEFKQGLSKIELESRQ